MSACPTPVRIDVAPPPEPGGEVRGEFDGQTASCARCARRIVWELDDETADPETSPGMWSTVEHGHDCCTPGPNDEDRWHTPPARVTP